MELVLLLLKILSTVLKNCETGNVVVFIEEDFEVKRSIFIEGSAFVV